MRSPVLVVWCVVALGQLGPTCKPPMRLQKIFKKLSMGLPRHGDAASLGAMIDITCWAMGGPKIVPES